jgi:hypothetical protein
MMHLGYSVMPRGTGRLASLEIFRPLWGTLRCGMRSEKYDQFFYIGCAIYGAFNAVKMGF